MKEIRVFSNLNKLDSLYSPQIETHHPLRLLSLYQKSHLFLRISSLFTLRELWSWKEPRQEIVNQKMKLDIALENYLSTK